MSRLRRTSVTAALLAASMVLAGCASNGDSAENGSQEESSETVTLQVAGVSLSTTDIVEAASQAIGDGYEIEVVEVSDYVTVNRMLNEGDVYANFAQHEPFMEEFNQGNNADLVAVQPVYNFVIGFYSNFHESLDDLPEGATVALANDSSNLGRGLKMLAEEGLIELDPEIDPYAATLDDIVSNPKNIDFMELEIHQLNTAYEEADLIFQWPAHIEALGLTPDDALITELDDVFALQLVVRAEDADSEATQALIAAFTSDEVRAAIEAHGTSEVAF